MISLHHRQDRNRKPDRKALSLSGLLLALGLTLGSLTATAEQGEADDPGFSEIVVFGASVSDVGNLNVLTAGSTVFIPFTQPPYFEGRFSNGPVWHEVLAERLGLEPASTPSLIGGDNFAFGGAESGPGGSFIFGLPNVGTQIDWYLTGIDPFSGAQTRPPANLSGDELLIVAGSGGNNLVPPGAPQEPEVIVAFIEEHITTLAEAGGKWFLVPNLFNFEGAPALVPGALDPELYTPGIQTEEDAQEIFSKTQQLNRQLRSALPRLERRLDREFGDVTIIQFDMFGVTRFMKRNPSFFGITNTTEQVLTPPFLGCFCTGVETGNPDEFFWYDSLHPTAIVHHVLGDVAAFAVKVRTRYR